MVVTMLIVEFESEGQAKQRHASEATAEATMKWVAAGTLDMSWNVFGIASRG